MSTLAEAGHNLLARFDAEVEGLPGRRHGWLKTLRHTARHRFAQTGLPTTRVEAWKYSDLTRVLPQLAAPMAAESSAALDASALAPFLIDGLDCHRAVVVDGRFVAKLGDELDALPAGATLCSFAEALERLPERIEPLLKDFHDNDPLLALNTALMRDGLYFELAEGVVLERPLHLIYCATDAAASRFSRNLIALHEGSRATLIVHHVALGEAADWQQVVTDIELFAGAELTHYELQQAGNRQLQQTAVHLLQHRDSSYRAHAAALGGAFSRLDLHAELLGEGADCAIDALALADGRRHADIHTAIDHAKPHCSSRQNVRFVLDGRARGVFNGKVVVHEGAIKTDAVQHNANLLLSRSSEIDTKPELKIYADDVKCAHGATVGQLDAHQLFYLRSRGIDEATARQMLIFAFADELLAAMELSPLRRHLEQIAAARLGGGA